MARDIRGVVRAVIELTDRDQTDRDLVRRDAIQRRNRLLISTQRADRDIRVEQIEDHGVSCEREPCSRARSSISMIVSSTSAQLPAVAAIAARTASGS